MPCASLYVVHHGDGFVDQVRCGRCDYCRRRRRMAWVGRMRLESSGHSHVRFLTLTYANDPGVLNVEHLQDFWKRFRYHYGPARYFAVGEYGDRFGRGHWHAITFGPCLALGRGSICEEAWPHGYNLVGSGDTKALSYVAAYTLKVSRKWDDKRVISRMSLRPGIGFNQIDIMAREAAKFRLPSWPAAYLLDGDRYPMCDGGLRHFMCVYLNEGGIPPRILSPEERTQAVYDLWFKPEFRGTRIESKRLLRRENLKGDRYAIKQEAKR